MACNGDSELEFYVVQFINLPFKGIEDYVCVPDSWTFMPGNKKSNNALVAYPNDESASVTSDRVKRRESHSDEWKFYIATVKYESNSYSDAQVWIARRNLVEKICNVSETQPRLSVNKKLQSPRQNDLLNSNNYARKPLPSILIKRPAQSESMKEPNEKRLKLEEPTPLSSRSFVQLASSKETANDNRETSTDNSFNKEPSSEQSQNSLKPFEIKLNQINEPKCLAPTPKTVETTIPMKNETTAATFSQKSNLMYQTMSSSTSSVEQLPAVTQTQSQDGLRDQTFKLPQQNELITTQHDSRLKLQELKIGDGNISIVPKNDWQTPSTQEVSNRTFSSALSKPSNSVRQAASSTNFLQNNQQRQASPNKSVPFNGSRRYEEGNACQTDECVLVETLSPCHAVTTDSNVVTNYEEIPDLEMSKHKLPARTPNNVKLTTNDSSCDVYIAPTTTVKPTAAQNSTAKRHQMNRKVNLEQKMLHLCITFFTQMCSTLCRTTDMDKTLRTYKTLLSAVKRFNKSENAANNRSLSCDPKPDVPLSSEERYTKGTVASSSNNEDQHTNDAANKSPKKTT